MIQTLSHADKSRARGSNARTSSLDGRDAAAGSIAHDLNNVLQIIGGNLAMLSRELGHSSVARRHIASAMAGVDLGTRLARRTLRKDAHSGENATVDLATSLQAIEQLVIGAVGPRVRVRVHICSPISTLWVNPAELQNVILNLAINAHDAMAGTGDLLIAATADPNGGVILAISDTGCGMSTETAERAFQPFFTTKGEAGSGLGLAAVKQFADQSGGTVSIISLIGAGTTIRLHLPSAPCHHMDGGHASSRTD